MMTGFLWSKMTQLKENILPDKIKAVCPAFWTQYMINTTPSKPAEMALALKFKDQS